MKSITFPPFLRPSANRVLADPWYLLKSSGPIELPEMLLEWDYNDVIELTRQISIDVASIRQDCSFGDSTALYLTVVYYSTGVRDRVCALRQPLSLTSDELSIDVSIPGEDLAGHLQIISQIVTGQRGSDDGPMAPTYSGSILWQDVVGIDLEGVGSRFPVHECDFTDDPTFPENAAWHLDIDFNTEDASFTQCVCLYVNSAKTRVIEAARGRSAESEGKAIAELMNYDLARTFVLLAIQNREWFDGISSAEPDSLRAVVHRLVKSLLDVTTHDQLLGLASNPSELAARIQARLRLLSD